MAESPEIREIAERLKRLEEKLGIRAKPFIEWLREATKKLEEKLPEAKYEAVDGVVMTIPDKETERLYFFAPFIVERKIKEVVE